MHLGQGENNIGLPATAELIKSGNDCCIFEVGIFLRMEFPLYLYTRVLIKIVITAEIVLVDEQVHLLTALATEITVIRCDRIITGFTTVVTGGLYLR